MSEFSVLADSGCLGHYQSARLTAITLHDRATKRNTLVFARVCMQAAPAIQQQPDTQKHNLTEQHGYAITEYDADLQTVRNLYQDLSQGYNSLHLAGHTLYTDKPKEMTRKFTGPHASNRENEFLAKSANGSYWIEFFNEDKRSIQPIYDPHRSSLLEKMMLEIQKQTGINIDKGRDRIGNVILQFPIITLSVKIESLDFGKSATINLDWHVQPEAIPELYVHAISLDENSVVDYKIEPHNGTHIQAIKLNLFDSGLKIRLFRKAPDLILHEWQCDCASITHMYATFTDDRPTIRSFIADGKRQEVALHWPNGAYNPIHHLYHTQMAVSRVNSKPAYRQFEAHQHTEAIAYLRELVTTSRSREILMIDPYLRASDLLNILYFSPMYGRRMRAIGSASAEVSRKLQLDQKASAMEEVLSGDGEARVQKIITEERLVLGNPDHSNLGLTLEFRLQHGNHGIKIHDRFLLFPGYPQDHVEPAAYSIGTSFNSVGESYHVIGSLQGPQDIIDNFEKQWEQLSAPECLVFRHFAGHYKFS